METICYNCNRLPTIRERAICHDLTDLLPSKRTKYINKWLAEGLIEEAKCTESLEQPTRKKSTVVVQHKRGFKKKAKSNGPGAMLVKRFLKAGVPSCQACKNLAARMDRWGVEECRKRLDVIVEEILPRALEWIAAKKPWVHKLLPEVIEAAAARIVIRLDIMAAIEEAEKPPPKRSHRLRRNYSSADDAHLFYAALPTIKPVTLDNPTRHLTFHVWPVAGYGAWQWNCDRLLANADLFNGRRIVGIAVNKETDSADAVKHYLRDFTDEFIVVQNDKKLGEVVNWLPMVERLESYQGPQDVTFYCHAKGVRHKVPPDQEGTTLYLWTAAMYETCLNWDAVRPLLETHGTVGSFCRSSKAGRNSWGPWHFSGTFFWWRNKDGFARNWRSLPKKFFGVEAWPGLMFRQEEASCLISDRVADLYDLQYWKRSIEPQLMTWRSQRGVYATS